MNLDLNMLREMISSTLNELNEPAATTEPEEVAVEKAEDTLEKSKQSLDAAKAAEEEAAEEEMEAAEEEEKVEKESSMEGNTMLAKESFEITKGRLRQIIAEELISAKKQGIL